VDGRKYILTDSHFLHMMTVEIPPVGMKVLAFSEVVELQNVQGGCEDRLTEK